MRSSSRLRCAIMLTLASGLAVVWTSNAIAQSPHYTSRRVADNATDLTQEDVAKQRGAFRTLDGRGNNALNPIWGSADQPLIRVTAVEYGDGVSSLGGVGRPSPRAISNAIVAQPGFERDPNGLSDFFWQWGQFLDHDMDLTVEADPAESVPIPVPMGDPSFDPMNSGTQTIEFHRSVWDPTTGTDGSNPRQQMNGITKFIDASNVYGSDETRAMALRANDGTGKLLVSAGNLLPFNTMGLPNAGGTGPELFVAGDDRVNEQAALICVHTLFVREHNRLCDEIATENPGLTGNEIYERARKFVGAQMQVITYNEWLPLLLGPGALPDYEGYDAGVNAGIANAFSTAAFRLGHSMLSGTLPRLDDFGNVVPEGHLALRDAFFNPSRIIDEGGIEPLLRGLANNRMQKLDNHIVDDVRNFLFGPPGSGGLDLASLNIQRGRDHGLADYNQARIDMGLAPVASFADITSDVDLQNALQSTYGDVNEIDVWVGGLCEEPEPGALVGELFSAILIDQFLRSRDGDSFWYEIDPFFTSDMIAELESTKLSDIILRNTSITNIQENVFIGESLDVPATSANTILVMGGMMAIAAYLIMRRKDLASLA